VVWILSCDVFSANWLEEVIEKNGKYKRDRHWMTKYTQRHEGKLRYRSLSRMQSEWKGVLYHRKGEGMNSDFDLRKSKI